MSLLAPLRLEIPGVSDVVQTRGFVMLNDDDRPVLGMSWDKLEEVLNIWAQEGDELSYSYDESSLEVHHTRPHVSPAVQLTRKIFTMRTPNPDEIEVEDLFDCLGIQWDLVLVESRAAAIRAGVPNEHSELL